MKRALPLLFLILLAALVMVKLVVLELVTVEGNDMAPTLQRGDRLLVLRLSRPRRGDVVLMQHPGGQRLLLRRVVGLPGEAVEVRGEVPVIDGRAAERVAVGDVEMAEAVDGTRQNRQLRLVKERLEGASYPVIDDPDRRTRGAPRRDLQGAVYVLADHRDHANDSRTFGPVPEDRVQGVVIYRISAGPGVVHGQEERARLAPLRQASPSGSGQ